MGIAGAWLCLLGCYWLALQVSGFSREQVVVSFLCRGLICRMVPEFGLLGRTGMLLVLA